MQVLSASDPKKHALTTKYGICDTGRLEVSPSLEVEEEELPVVGGVTSIVAGCSKNDEEEWVL